MADTEETILVTGAQGFIGRNLCLSLRRGGKRVLEIGSSDSEAELREAVAAADAVVHLAGVNRPDDEGEFETGNHGFTAEHCALLAATGRPVPVVFASSTQAKRDNAYGKSKAAAEDELLAYAESSGAPVYVFRLPNVFGKWSRPDYNTVVATFCHNISRGLPVRVDNPDALLRFAYVDDVVARFTQLAAGGSEATGLVEFSPAHEITLGALHDLIVSFQTGRGQAMLADFGDPLTKYLYSTYLSFLDRSDLGRPVDLKTDDRGWLFELIKSPTAGQIFVSSTKPGITRGNHYHDTKVEKFCVVKGRGVIRFRHVLEDDVFEYPVDDTEIKVVDIPPGYTHSIVNTGESEMVTLFWANEIFDPEQMDTYFEEV